MAIENDWLQESEIFDGLPQPSNRQAFQLGHVVLGLGNLDVLLIDDVMGTLGQGSVGPGVEGILPLTRRDFPAVRFPAQDCGTAGFQNSGQGLLSGVRLSECACKKINSFL